MGCEKPFLFSFYNTGSTTPAEVVFNDESGVAYPPVAIRVIPYRFGLYEDFSGNFGLPARAFHIVEGARVGVNLTSPAISGEVVTLQGTGMGLAESKDVSVAIGDLTLPANLRRMDGVDELDFTLPPDANLSVCYIPLRVYVNGDASNIGSLPVMREAGPCSHPLGLSTEQLKALDSGDSIPFGTLSMWSFDSSLDQTFRESLGGSFLQSSSTAIAKFLGLDLIGSGHSCQLYKIEGPTIGTLLEPNSRVRPVDVGDEMRIRTPDGQTITLQRASSFSFYNAGGEPRLVNSGNWQVTTDGGRDVSPLDWSFMLPRKPQFDPPLISPIIRKGIDPEIRRDPEGYSEDDILTITISTNRHQLSCSVPAINRHMTVPVGALFASEQLSTLRLAVYMEISRRPSRPIVLPMPLRNGTMGAAMLKYSLAVEFVEEVQLVE